MKTHCTKTPGSISVVALDEETGARAAASCDAALGPGLWWVSRVVVHPPSHRGSGLGSRVLKMIQRALLEQEPVGVRLLVVPGGYGNNVEQQARFYRKNGFVPAPEFGMEALVWPSEGEFPDDSETLPRV